MAVRMAYWLSAIALLAVSLAPAAMASSGSVSASVNHRSGPGTGYAVIQVVPYGANVEIIECPGDGRWCQVSYAGQSGWVWADYVTVAVREAEEAYVSNSGPVSVENFFWSRRAPMLTYGEDNDVLRGDPLYDEWPWYRKPFYVE